LHTLHCSTLSCTVGFRPWLLLGSCGCNKAGLTCVRIKTRRDVHALDDVGACEALQLAQICSEHGTHGLKLDHLCGMHYGAVSVDRLVEAARLLQISGYVPMPQTELCMHYHQSS
jgi:hypothetical protein